jgi:regulatory protein
MSSPFPDDYFAAEVDQDQPSRSNRRKSTQRRRSDESGETQQVRQVSPEKLEQRAKNILLHQLSRQAKSEFQLREVLTNREIPGEIIDKVIERFTEAGLIDDKQVAQTIAHTRRATRGLSSSAIRRELSRKGIAVEICDEVLSEFAQEDELETATKLAGKKLRSLQLHEPEVRRRRTLGFLARKGYAGSVSYAALKAAELEFSS